MPADMVPVKFTKPTLPYNTGETAWFSPEQAAAYIKQGFAERDKGAGTYRPARTRMEVMAEEEAAVLDATRRRQLAIAEAEEQARRATAGA